MQKTLQLFPSFQDADRADEEYYASLSPRQRVELLLELVRTYTESSGEAARRFERVYCVTELSRDQDLADFKKLRSVAARRKERG